MNGAWELSVACSCCQGCEEGKLDGGLDFGVWVCEARNTDTQAVLAKGAVTLLCGCVDIGIFEVVWLCGEMEVPIGFIETNPMT